jgi:hypothetical protein
MERKVVITYPMINPLYMGQEVILPYGNFPTKNKIDVMEDVYSIIVKDCDKNYIELSSNCSPFNNWITDIFGILPYDDKYFYTNN